MFFSRPGWRFSQNRHPCYYPSENPDFDKNDGECHNNFHPRGNVPDCGIPPETDYLNIQPVQYNSQHGQHRCHFNHSNIFYPVTVEIKNHGKKNEPDDFG